MIEGIHAKLDREKAGFGLCVYVSVTLGAHEEATERRFAEVVAELPEVTAAAWSRGDRRSPTVNCRDLTELQHVLSRLATKGGAWVLTLLRLGELSPTAAPARRSAASMADPRALWPSA